MKDLALAVDCGTQSIRVIIFDDQGNLLSKVKKNLDTPYFSTAPNYAEQNVTYFWETLCSACQELKSKSPELWERLSVMSVTTIRDSYVCVDENFKQVRPMILWLDQRKAPVSFSKDLPFINRLLFTLVGMKPSVFKQMEKGSVNWIMKNEKENWDKTYKFMSYCNYIDFMLTGKTADSIASNIGHIPFDYQHHKWASKRNLKRCLFPIPREKLCDLIPSGTVLGHITQSASIQTGIPEGLPVVVSGSDKGCETLGVGCIGEGIASLGFGTTATVQVTTDKYVEPIAFMPAYPSVIHGKFNPEVQIFRGYWMVSWFKSEFAKNEEPKAKSLGISLEELLDKELENIPIGCDGLVLQPFWTPGLKEPEGRGTVIGFTDCHTRAHIYRAIIEGIGFGLFEGLKNIEKRTKIKTKCIAVSGGGSSSDEICQITADMFGIPVKRVQTYETSALGAAISAFVGIRRFSDYEEGVNSMVRYTDTFIPNMENHKIYLELLEKVYKKLYKRVKPLYQTLTKIEGRK